MTRYYEDFLKEQLEDPEEAIGYLEACLEEGFDVFLLALRDVAKAYGSLTQFADDADISRRALYKMLSEDGNPTIANLTSVLDALGATLGKKLSLSLKIEGTEAA
ncbi:transcriptional regulator [bacterium]|nr:transcriptional regulator [bacterium]